ncbi:MAG: hypothetical protein K2Q26_01675 [Bdellovibrionales bacterium]|nr:hypothetical protein [Bdellovibrionales bacterium]
MKFLSLVSIFIFSTAAFAGDIEWNGTYRMEGFKLDNAELNNLDRNTQYALHHLVLRPKITAYDGVTIHGRFDVLNNNSYLNSSVGQFFGSGLTPPTPAAADPLQGSNTLSNQQRAELITVNELYLSYVHDFGLLTVGRAPLHFGLGMSYNAGTGAFDHWFDNRDMASYKFFLTGNVSFTPIIAKMAENNIAYGDDVDETMLKVEYENPETELILGILYLIRKSGSHGNDTNPGAVGGAALGGQFNAKYANLFFQRWIGNSFKFGLEAGMQEGETGINNGAAAVELDGFGLALELDYIPKEGNFHAGLKAGVATGDDPETTNVYEGYIFNRNYDVAMIMFNHPVGGYDIFRTSSIRSTTLPVSEQVDTEALSNVIYFAPYFKYKWSDKFDSQLGLTYASLNSDPLNVEVDKAVGFEVDVTLTYKPYDGIQWVNRVGVFAPGSAFEGGTNQFETKTIYGLETKAAITF